MDANLDDGNDKVEAVDGAEGEEHIPESIDPLNPYKTLTRSQVATIVGLRPVDKFGNFMPDSGGETLFVRSMPGLAKVLLDRGESLDEFIAEILEMKAPADGSKGITTQEISEKVGMRASDVKRLTDRAMVRLGLFENRQLFGVKTPSRRLKDDKSADA